MRLSLRSFAVLLALSFLFTPDPAAAQGIFSRARRAVERGVNRAANDAQRRLEDEANSQADAALANAFGEAGSELSSVLGLSGSSGGSLENGDIVATNLQFESGTATPTADTRDRLVRLGRQYGEVNRQMTEGASNVDAIMRVRFIGFESAGGHRLARQRADAARDIVMQEGNLRRGLFRIESGTARSGDGELGAQVIEID